LPADALNFLRERLDEAIGGRRNAMSFAKLHPGATYRTLQSCIAEATGRPISFFLPAEAPPPEPPLVKIPVLDVSAAAGAGRAADVVRAVGELALPREFVRTFARPDADLSCLRCAGDSMAPTIQDNAMLIIDERQKVPRRWRAPARKAPRERQKPDEIFVFNQSGDLRLKRLRDLGDDFLLIWSDNHIEHPPEVFRRGRDGGLSIIGKVIWWDTRL
jgi:phage repressor protein C with HTH and peptisase S24 domain